MSYYILKVLHFALFNILDNLFKWTILVANSQVKTPCLSPATSYDEFIFRNTIRATIEYFRVLHNLNIYWNLTLVACPNGISIGHARILKIEGNANAAGIAPAHNKAEMQMLFIENEVEHTL